MKALSIIQPWASLIALGAKRIETRSWRTEYCGPVAIHASKRFPEDCGILCFDEPFRTVLSDYLREIHGSRVAYLPTGSILATVDLVDCLPVQSIHSGLFNENEWSFGDFSAGRFGWIFENVKRLQRPIQCKGAQGLWTVPEEIEERLKCSL